MLRVDWTQTKNISANTSTITAKAYLVNDWNLNIYGRSDNTLTVDGTAQNYASPAISGTGTTLLGTVTQTVSHASDGTKSLNMSAVFYIRATLSGTYYESITASATITLDSIARASSVSASNATMGSASTINISRASSSFTHTLTYTFGSANGTIATKTTATSVSWTPPVSLASQIPKAVTGTCTITCTTYNGSTRIGSKTCTLTLTVPSSVKPTITSLTAVRVDGDVPGAWGIYVQTKSKAKLTINGAAGSYGSTVSSYSITGGGYTSTASSFTTGFLNSSGSITFTATVTDSRGRVSAAATVTISVVSYSPPAFASYLSQRCLSNGTAKDGFYLEPTNGYIMSLPNEALRKQLEYLGEDMPESIYSQLATASEMYYRFDANLEQKKKAINILADILENERGALKDMLNEEYEIGKNEHDKLIFNIVNGFNIRHNRADQKSNYSKEIWYDWMMQYYTSVIIAYYKLKKEHEEL